MSAQKVIITLTDKGDGKIGFNLAFDPHLNPDKKSTPAVLLALDMVQFVSQKNLVSKVKENS